MANFRVLFDGVEYFTFESAVLTHSLSNSIALKEASASAYPMIPFKNFIIELNKRGVMLATIYANNELYCQSFITPQRFYYGDSPDGCIVNFRFIDRFFGLAQSDIVRAKPRGTIKAFFGNVLHELGYDSPDKINTYPNPKKNVYDLIGFSSSVKSSANVMTFPRKDLGSFDGLKILSEVCNLHNFIIISNGSDMINIEIPNENRQPEALISRNQFGGQILSISKNGEGGEENAATTIIVNSSQVNGDSNTAVIYPYKYGMPHLQKVRHVNYKASYAQIAKQINFSMAGITARDNSFLINCAGLITTTNKKLFQPNDCIKVFDDYYGIDEIMNVMQVEYRIDPSGVTSIFNLTTLQAFDNNASIKQKRSLMR